MKPILSYYLFLLLFTFSVVKGSCSPDSTNFINFSKIDSAWQYSKGENVKIAVVDWLFDLSPKGEKKYVFPASMIAGAEVGSDKPWHGEWMAEIIHLIAPEAKIIPIRAQPGNGESYEPYLIKAIKYAADMGAAAVTSSMGPVKNSKEFIDAVEYAWRKGTIFIDVHPEYSEKTADGFKWCTRDEYSSKIIHPGIVSVPGHNVKMDSVRDIFTWPYQLEPKYKDGWGYSNAPPIIGGVIALMKSANPLLTPDQLKEIIISSANEIDGFKVLDACAAVKEAIRKR